MAFLIDDLLLKIERNCLNRTDLIKRIQEKCALSQQQATKAVNVFFDSLTESMIEGEDIEIRDFCVFRMKKYKSYWGINPKTGEKVLVAEKKMPLFKCGKELRERVNKQKIKTKTSNDNEICE